MDQAVRALLHTWPLATDLAHLTRHDNRDSILNKWTVGWVAHQLSRAPLHLFDGNIFHLERYTLAYSEPMVVQGVMAMPRLRGIRATARFGILATVAVAALAAGVSWRRSSWLWRRPSRSPPRSAWCASTASRRSTARFRARQARSSSSTRSSAHAAYSSTPTTC